MGGLSPGAHLSFYRSTKCLLVCYEKFNVDHTIIKRK